jgi:prepilin-type N-terminal cleavage/methylation domain-containing protein
LDGGYTLVEVMVAMLLTSIMVTAVFSVTLTAKTGGAKGERKLMASAGASQVAAQLKNFVRGDSVGVVIRGPGTGANSWSMTGGSIVDSCGDCYALTPGLHTLTGVLPAAFEAPPYNARVSYTVTMVGSIPSVSITTVWTDP